MLPSILSILTLLPVPLTERLASPRYRIRAAAHRTLAAFGWAAVPTLERAARTHADPEVRGRCAVLLRPYAWRLADRDAWRLCPRPPWLDTYNMWPHEYGEFLARGRQRCGQARCGKPDWPEYRLATHYWVRSQMLQRRPADEIRERLRWMELAELDWKRDNPPR